MPLPIPVLDDRTFDDLVQEATARLHAHTPEYSNIAPGDPGAALIDVFAWLTETILYRQNLIPLRQRRAFLNLLSIPLRPAAPAGGIVCVDATKLLPPEYAKGELTFSGGPVRFTSNGDLQPMPLQLVPMIKAKHQIADPVQYQKLIATLRTLYNYDQPAPFVARAAFGADGTLSLGDSVDGQVWLAMVTPKNFADSADTVRAALVNLTLSIGIAPVDNVPGYQAFDQATELPPRTLNWALVTTDGAGNARQVPLKVVADTSNGARNRGVARLRLPNDARLLAPPAVADPMYAGTSGTPPELPVDISADRVVLWLTMNTADVTALKLAYLAVNAVEVIAQVTETDQPLGAASGEGDAHFQLRGAPVDPDSLVVEVWQAGQAATWTAIDNFGRAGPNDAVYVLDATSGTITFGDGIRGQRPPYQSVIVARRYAWGGGSSGNLAPGSIKAVAPAIGTVRHDWPTSGGDDGETVAQAERRIPAFLANRDRAVTIEDFQQLALATPGIALGRAEVVQGLLPGTDADATREGVPGVVSVFVFPDGPIAMGGGPVATLRELRDVFAFLRQRILVGTQLFVLSAEPVPLYVGVTIRLKHGADPVSTARDVQQVLLSYLWTLAPGGPDGSGWPLGRDVPADELLTQAARTPGVLAVDGVTLYSKSAAGWVPASTLVLKDWQVPAPEGIGVASDGSSPAPPAEPTGGQLVPVVPDVC